LHCGEALEEASSRWSKLFGESSAGRARKRFCCPVLVVDSPLRAMTAKPCYLFRSSGLVQKPELISQRFPFSIASSSPKISRSTSTAISGASGDATRSLSPEQTFQTNTRNYLPYAMRQAQQDEKRKLAGKPPKPVKQRKGKTHTARLLDSGAITNMGVKYICDLMLEDLLKLHGVSLVGSEKVCVAMHTAKHIKCHHCSTLALSLSLSRSRSLSRSL
jgi:hypothetical protein